MFVKLKTATVNGAGKPVENKAAVLINTDAVILVSAATFKWRDSDTVVQELFGSRISLKDQMEPIVTLLTVDQIQLRFSPVDA
jgi:hypothetical protein